MILTKEMRKEIIENYPYLQPRNVFTDKIPENYDYEYLRGERELPEGWIVLFFRMCEDIKQPLIDANYLDKFRFIQIKEKYNSMCCYHNSTSPEVIKIIQKYEAMAHYICTRCGHPATKETKGYFASYCDRCYNKYISYDDVEEIKFKDNFNVTHYKGGKEWDETISFADEWKRYFELKFLWKLN